jgi:hypothetical protein
MPCPPTDLAVWLDHAVWAVWGAALVTVLPKPKKKRKKPVRTTLASGAYIEHVPIQDIKGKHIRDYARAGRNHIDGGQVDDEGNVDVRAIVTSTNIGEQRELKHDALWAIVITGWSYDFPVPRFDRGSGETAGAEVLDEISADDYAEIERLLVPFARKLDIKPNPKGATTSASSGSSKGRANGSHRA